MSEQARSATRDEHRAAFEQWVAKTYHSSVEFDVRRNCYKEFPVHMAWQAWRAASTACSAATDRSRQFHVCKDHKAGDWNEPEGLDGEDRCVLCRLFYLEAQESLLEEWQQRAKRAEEAIAEIQRPLDEQMARLNATVVRLNEENEQLRKLASSTTESDAPEQMWQRFVDYLAISDPVGPKENPNIAHKSFLGSVAWYRTRFMEANATIGSATTASSLVDNGQVLKALVTAIQNEMDDSGGWIGRRAASKLRDVLSAAKEAVADRTSDV